MAKKGERELYLLPFLVDPSRLAIDVGANTGLYTHALLRLGGKVVSIEANPSCGRVLRRLYGRSMTLFPVAVSDVAGAARLRLPAGSQESGLSTIEAVNTLEGSETIEIHVPMQRIDDLPLENVGFMKIDVEGHELSVLHGAKALLLRDKPVILVEAEDRHRPNAVTSVRDYLYSLGYIGLFCHEGRLRSLDDVETATLQKLSPADSHALNRGLLPKGYVNNFVFLPAMQANNAARLND